MQEHLTKIEQRDGQNAQSYITGIDKKHGDVIGYRQYVDHNQFA